MANQNLKQKLKEIHEKLKKWSNHSGDEELDSLLDELEAAFAPADDGDGDEGSNPPGGPGTPP